MPSSRPYVLSIAGFDPSAGAGILADIKTFESNEVYGFGACTAITYQNEIFFKDVDWISLDKILEQINILNQRFQIEFVKIGIVENMYVLEEIIKFLKSRNKNVKIIWDPILNSSSGFQFHNSIDFSCLERICKNIFLITPNLEEIIQLLPNKKNAAEFLSLFCYVFLKGGHSNDEDVTDTLFFEDKKIPFISERIQNGTKHGSGCVLSAAILSNLAKGKSIVESCDAAKRFISKYLESNSSLLGYQSLIV